MISKEFLIETLNKVVEAPSQNPKIKPVHSNNVSGDPKMTQYNFICKNDDKKSFSFESCTKVTTSGPEGCALFEYTQLIQDLNLNQKTTSVSFTAKSESW